MMRRYIILALGCLIALPMKAAERPSASELLYKYAETQDKFKSFIIKSEDSIEVSSPILGKEKQRKNLSSEIRFDGSRGNLRAYAWGQVQTGEDFIPKDKAAYVSYLCDGKQFSNYSTSADPDLGRGTIDRDKNRYDLNLKQMISRGLEGHEAMGFFSGDEERVDSILLHQPDAVSIRDKMEQAGGTECYVIDAETKDGKYSVWIDPEHGYNIAKAVVQRQENDLFYGRTLKKEEYDFCSLKNVRFEKIDGIWVPMEFDTDLNRNADFGKQINPNMPVRLSFEQKGHHKRTVVILNPDHDKLGSFVRDDIKNGALVLVVGVEGITYKWQDGKLIPDIDKAAIDQMDKMTGEIIAKGEVPPSLKAKKEPGTVPATVSDLLDKYAATQNKLRSFIAKAESTIEYSETPSRAENQRCEFRTDGNKVSHRATFWDNLTTTRDKPGYKSFLWDGQSLIQYTQGLEPKNNAVSINKNEQRKKEIVATEYKGAPLMGICAGDVERVDLILRKADNISLAKRTETISDSNCYVINARTKEAQYKVWIDPQHGHNIAKIEVQRKDKAEVTSFLLENVRFESIDHVWVPMEADMQQTEGNRKTTRCHHKRVQFVLNPDHNKLGSFVADDILEGTKVSIQGTFGKEYVWRDGKAVQEVNK